LILASASPRRRELLAGAGLWFDVEPAGVDESVDSDTDPLQVAALLAERKARHVATSLRGEVAWVIGADTVVAVEIQGVLRLLGKPEDEAEARQFLRWLSATRHQVVTGVCVVGPSSDQVLVESERTWVKMRPIEEAEVTAYVSSGEWRDKAGGYAIQESADAFVLALEEGGFDNVVGLPVERTIELLRRAGYMCVAD